MTKGSGGTTWLARWMGKAWYNGVMEQVHEPPLVVIKCPTEDILKNEILMHGRTGEFYDGLVCHALSDVSG
jgi:hypothetical protein